MVTHIKVSTIPANLDTVTLKNGAVLKGKIIKETDDTILLSVYLKKGSASLDILKVEISKIEYGKE